MSKYNNYGQFMTAVIEDAENKCASRYSSSLSRIFNLPAPANGLFHITTAIFNIGWYAFVAVHRLLLLGPIAFAVALVAFIAGGIGALVVAALAIYGGAQAIKLLYNYKIIPFAIYKIGQRYKSRFESHIDDVSYIDNLIDEASDDLIKEAWD